MSRATLLQTPCDPFINLLWLHFYRKWKDEVGQLYVYLNAGIDKEVKEYIKNTYLAEGAIVRDKDMVLQHGDMMVEQLKEDVKEDYVLLIEDDCYVWEKGVIDTYFKKIENGECDIVGSARTSSSMDVQRVASRRFNIDISGVGDVGCSFWPNMFFIKREHLLKTSLHFRSTSWKKEEYIPSLEWVCQPDNNVEAAGDTFVLASFELLNMRLKVFYIPQYHTHPYWEGEQKANINMWDGRAKYLHSGSLSSGVMGLLRDEHGRKLADRQFIGPERGEKELPKGAVTNEGEQKEHERRVAFYLLAFELTKEELHNFPDFVVMYSNALMEYVRQLGLRLDQIHLQKEAYRSLMGV